jgi:hypothetical protein
MFGTLWGLRESHLALRDYFEDLVWVKVGDVYFQPELFSQGIVQVFLLLVLRGPSQCIAAGRVACRRDWGNQQWL